MTALSALLLDQSSLSIADNSLNILGVVEVSFVIDDSCSTHAQPGSRKVRPNALVTSLRPLWGYASRIYVMTLQDTPFLFIIKIYNAVPPQVVLLALDGLDCVFQVLVPQRTVFSASEQLMPEAKLLWCIERRAQLAHRVSIMVVGQIPVSAKPCVCSYG